MIDGSMGNNEFWSVSSVKGESGYVVLWQNSDCTGSWCESDGSGNCCQSKTYSNTPWKSYKAKA